MAEPPRKKPKANINLPLNLIALWQVVTVGTKVKPSFSLLWGSVTFPFPSPISSVFSRRWTMLYHHHVHDILQTHGHLSLPCWQHKLITGFVDCAANPRSGLWPCSAKACPNNEPVVVVDRCNRILPINYLFWLNGGKVKSQFSPQLQKILIAIARNEPRSQHSAFLFFFDHEFLGNPVKQQYTGIQKPEAKKEICRVREGWGVWKKKIKRSPAASNHTVHTEGANPCYVCVSLSFSAWERKGCICGF